MDTPIMLEPREVAADTHILPAYTPVPGFGILPANAFVIRSAEPVLVDAGLFATQDAFMQALESVLDPADLRWVWITHTDPDHIGALSRVLEAAPQAKVVTTYLGMGKMGLRDPLPMDRVHLLNPGQRLAVGDRRLLAITPPSYDAPETTALVDERTGALFSADCFGGLMREPAEDASSVPTAALRDGMITWATVDSPWLHGTDTATLGHALGAVRDLDPSIVLGAHLPPARGMTDTLLGHLAAARTAPRFVGPDQAALMQMLGAAAE